MRVLLLLAVALLVPAVASSATTENTSANSNVVRELVGTLRLQTKSDQRYRGIEQWRVFVHRDGSRTMILSKDFVAVNALQIMTVHVSPTFRPIDAHATYWTNEGYRGSIRVTLHDTTLSAVSAGPDGEHRDELQVPEQVSIVTHGESMNGWYLWQGEADRDGTHRATYFNLNPSPDGRALVRGRLHPATFRQLGHETISVPAGSFETDVYLLRNIKMWIAGADRILIKQSIVDEDKEYILTRLETRRAEQP